MFHHLNCVFFLQVSLPVNVLPVSFPGHAHSQSFNAPDDLPKTVARTLNQGSSPMSMDFHPIQQTLLLGWFCNLILFSFVKSSSKCCSDLICTLLFLSDNSVGTNVGDIGLWEVGSRERLVQKNFKVWDLSACTMPLQVSHFSLVKYS